MTQYDNLPVLAMRGNFFFPNIRAKVEVARDISRNAIKYALDNGGKFFMVSQLDGIKNAPNKPEDLYQVGVIAEIASVESATSESTVVVTRTLEAAKVVNMTMSDKLIFANVQTLDFTCNNDTETHAWFDETIKYITKLAETDKNIKKAELKNFTSTPDIDYLTFTNLVANEIVTRLPFRQEILEETSIEKRLEKICVYIEGELEIVKVEKRISNRVKEQVQDGQKEYYLREQMKAISVELGD
ncbi:MAG: LON peptidase substrate-binding domain-containing protein, partial [Clostridia bacterium]|nr:LON peptidase substrate-binding domain-containing protein [Clostridia bacterium]